MTLGQGREFQSSSSGNGVVNSLLGKLSSVVTLQNAHVVETLRGMSTDPASSPTVSDLRSQLASSLDSINSTYEQEVLHNSRLIDDFDKKLDAQRKRMVDELKNSSYRGDDANLKSLSGRLEDSGTFVRLGNSRYVVFAVLAIIILSFTMHHSDINTTGYVVVSIILGAVIVFMISYFNQKSNE